MDDEPFIPPASEADEEKPLPTATAEDRFRKWVFDFTLRATRGDRGEADVAYGDTYAARWYRGRARVSLKVVGHYLNIAAGRHREGKVMPGKFAAFVEGCLNKYSPGKLPNPEVPDSLPAEFRQTPPPPGGYYRTPAPEPGTISSTAELGEKLRREYPRLHAELEALNREKEAKEREARRRRESYRADPFPTSLGA